MATVAGEGKVISNFALTHFSASKHFSNKTYEIEKANAGQPFGNFWQEISIYCASSVMTAAASLEALINELFVAPGDLQRCVQRCVGDFDTFFWGGEVTTRRCLLFRTRKRIQGLEREPALEKYKRAIRLLGKPPLSRTDNEYRAAETLIGFRNYLIHFKPLWDESRRNDDLEQRLKGLFALSPYVDGGASFIEMKCMSSGCSAWAVQTVIDFVSYFGARSGLDAKKLGAFK